MNAGDKNAESGMAKAIYDAMNAALGERLSSEDKLPLQDNWKKLSHAVADGAVRSLQTDPFFAWFAGLVKVVTTEWAPTTPDGLALQSALKKYLAEKPIPNEMRGLLP
jgi:hypothetical protein